MSTEFYRKYLDIITENSQPKVQLDESMIDTIKPLLPKLIKSLPVKEIADKVKQVTGGDLSLSQENAIKVAKAFGFDKMNPEQSTNEGIVDKVSDFAGNLLYGNPKAEKNWKTKLVKILKWAGVLTVGLPLVAIGIVLLIIASGDVADSTTAKFLGIAKSAQIMKDRSKK